jgi:simple sugar transport system permease protein
MALAGELVLGSGVNDSFLVVVLASAVVYGTPLLYAALGELLAERSGILNLGVEGMMLVGAVTGFWAVQRVHVTSPAALAFALAVAALSGAAMALIHAFLCITLRASQIVSGLALTIFAGAAGLSSYLGNDLKLADSPARHSFKGVDLFGLKDVPVVGPILLDQSVLVYGSWLAVLAVSVYLARTRPGLKLRAVGESPAAADVMGVNVARYRYGHTIVGGAFAGIGGACYSLEITPQWVTGLTGGAGWIAIALVIFAFWRPDLCLVGAYLFGAFSALPFALQARGYLQDVPSEVFQSLPYVMTVVVLVVVSSGLAKRRLGAPAALGTPYVREER